MSASPHAPVAPDVTAADRVAIDRTELQISPDTRLDARTLGDFARRVRPQVRFTAAAHAAMRRSEQALAARHAAGDDIYGLTTGFGPHVRFDAALGGGHPDGHGAGLLAHLGAGCGAPMPATVVRAAMIARCVTLGRGFSAISPDVAEALAGLLATGVVPAVPQIGSVGASGDLIPMAHVARVIVGQGQVLTEAGPVAAAPVLQAAGVTPRPLSGREALGLVNGTNFMTAYAAMAVDGGWRLLERAEAATGWLYRALGARSQALDPRLHMARGHGGQQASAAAIRLAAGDPVIGEDTTRPLQEVYSVRCAPQFLGACREQLAHASRLIDTELAGVADNPITWSHDDEVAVIHGGNFQGQQLAFAADAINAALVQIAILAERQIDVLLNPELNGGAPLLLAWEPGPCAGLAGGQLTATALVAEMRHHGGPAATASIPTNGGNQDVVSMGLMAARQAHGQIERLASVLAILVIALRQLEHLRRAGRAPGPAADAPGWCPAYEPFSWDRAIDADIPRIADALLGD